MDKIWKILGTGAMTGLIIIALFVLGVGTAWMYDKLGYYSIIFIFAFLMIWYIVYRSSDN